MDVVTYALLNKKVKNVTLAYDYKGSVSAYSDLPDDASKGDLYTIGPDQYVYDGTSWIMVGGAITNAQIDTIFQ